MHTILFLCLSIFELANGCQMSIGKATWDFDSSRDAMIPDYSLAKCEDRCWNYVGCKGFTHQDQGVLKVCFLFQELNNLHACSDCNSGITYTKIENSECTGGVSLGLIDDTWQNDCIRICKNTPNCAATESFFSWTGPGYCILYDYCEPKSSTDLFSTAFLSCFELPPQCKEYKILDSRLRNENTAMVENYFYGDHLGCSRTSSDWEGEFYYRFKQPAGVKMPEYFPQYNMCSSSYPGWVNGTHPTKIGIEKSVDIEFGYDNVKETITAWITNCGDFYVYKLDDAPGCDTAYCGTSF